MKWASATSSDSGLPIALEQATADVEAALGGFFCNGEIGPVGGTTFVHGYTSAFGIVRTA